LTSFSNQTPITFGNQTAIAFGNGYGYCLNQPIFGATPLVLNNSTFSSPFQSNSSKIGCTNSTIYCFANLLNNNVQQSVVTTDTSSFSRSRLSTLSKNNTSD